MIWLVASACIQIICAVHVIRTGRNQIWMLFIFLFSIMGCFAYLILEVLPGYWGNRHVRTVRSQAIEKIDPERRLRAAQHDVELTDTAANHIALGDALAELGRHREAIIAYRDGLARWPGEDRTTSAKLAQALFETGASHEALALLDHMPEVETPSEQDRRNLLRGRILADLGRDAEARLLFEEVLSRIPGEQARCHYAAFLIARGDRFRARQILEEVEQRARRLDRTQRAAEADMYRWASEQLSTLRAG